MIEVSARAATVTDYRKLPPDDWHYQLIEGEIVNMAPAPNFFHQKILLNLAAILHEWLKENQTGQVMIAPLDVYLTDTNVFQPDVLFVRNSRESIIEEDGLHGAPDFAVEILSPHTARYDLNQKRAVYAMTGVEELWLVYPQARRIDVHNLQENAEAVAASHGLGATFASPLFPGLEFRTADIFRAR